MPPNVSGKDKLEKILFEIICLMIIMVMLHGMIQGLILYHFNLLSTVEFIVALIGALFFYLSRFKNQFELLRIPLVIFTNLCLVFFWFWFGVHLSSSTWCSQSETLDFWFFDS